MSPTKLDDVATDSILAEEPVKVVTKVDDQADGLKVYEDIDIRSPRADHSSNRHIDKLDQ